MKIKTEYIFPPVPIRCFDWVAWIDGEEENGFCGFGITEEEARQDLMNNL